MDTKKQKVLALALALCLTAGFTLTATAANANAETSTSSTSESSKEESSASSKEEKSESSKEEKSESSKDETSEESKKETSESSKEEESKKENSEESKAESSESSTEESKKESEASKAESTAATTLTPAAPATPIESDVWYSVETAKSFVVTAKSNEIGYIRTRSSTPVAISKDALQAMAGYEYLHDTVVDEKVQVRVIMKPENSTRDIHLGGYVTSDTVAKAASIFKKWFVNKTAVVALDMPGDYGMLVEVAARVDLTGLDTDNLAFYSYDAATNSFKLLTEAKYYIDSNDYLHFATYSGNCIVISDGFLVRN